MGDSSNELDSLFPFLVGCTALAIALAFVVGWDKPWLLPAVTFLGGLAFVVARWRRRRRGD